MQIFTTKKALQSFLKTIRKEKSIGFVPTMGALHQGHISLMKKAKEQTDVLVVSIFVNPTQFDNAEDLEKYPQTLEADSTLLRSIHCDVLYTPNADDVYDGVINAADFDFDGLEFQMEGKFRDGHFNGVGTVVKKLFEIVQPDMAFFGEKDFQQLQIIKKMVAKKKLSVTIIGCPIFREKDGLAMSSRNTRLTKKHRENAPFIYKTLQEAKLKFTRLSPDEVSKWVEQEFSKNDWLDLEYFTIAEEETLQTVTQKETGKQYRGFVAAYAGKIRLIDNICLSNN